MGLDQDLCRMARDLYRWEISFEGGLAEARVMVRDDDWISMSTFPRIGIATQLLDQRITYGFVNRVATTLFQAYKPVAMVYERREKDYQREFLTAALLHLRKECSQKALEMVLPASFTRYLESCHLSLLDRDNREVSSFPGDLVRIFDREDQIPRAEMIRSWKICPSTPQQ